MCSEAAAVALARAVADEEDVWRAPQPMEGAWRGARRPCEAPHPLARLALLRAPCPHGREGSVTWPEPRRWLS